jgi:hypothetical protein
VSSEQGKKTARCYEEREEWVKQLIARAALPPGVRLVGVALAGHLNITTGQLNPSAATLGRETSQTERAARKALSRLRDDGFIDWRSSHGRTSNRYELISPNDQTGLRADNREHADTVSRAQSGTRGQGDHERVDRATMNHHSANDEQTRVQPCPGVHPNLVNLEENLSGNDAVQLRARIARLSKKMGHKQFEAWLGKAAFECGPPVRIIMSSETSASLIASRFGVLLRKQLGEGTVITHEAAR